MLYKGILKKAEIRKQKLKNYIKKQKTFKMCEKCRDNCESNYLCCNICEKAFHQKCMKISKKKGDIFRKHNSYICSDNCLISQLPFHNLNDIDFFCFLKGDGKFPCKKCKRDCLLDDMSCIQCDVCDVWVHYPCTNLSAKDSNEAKEYFCSIKCIDSVKCEHDKSTELSELEKLVNP